MIKPTDPNYQCKMDPSCGPIRNSNAPGEVHTIGWYHSEACRYANGKPFTKPTHAWRA